MTALATAPKVAFYGDDFTGATDTLATAARAGLRTVLFLGVPQQRHLAQAGRLDCLGIAGSSRAMSPVEMQRELGPVAEFLSRLGAPLTHYKVCSTFDSSARIGSIGAAVRILRPVAASPLVAIVAGQPNLGRFCAFGNLFARSGTGGAVHRIDRHPTMSRHPVTPMREADLRIHLARQGLEAVESFDYTEYDAPAHAQEQRVDALLASGPDAVLFDVAHPRHLRAVGRILWERASRETMLAVGASTVIHALAAHWSADDAGTGLPDGPASTAADSPVFVLSGSLSPVTARQFAAARSFVPLRVDVRRLAQPDIDYQCALARDAAALLAAGSNVLASTSGEDPSTRDAGLTPRAVAEACAAFVARVIELVPLRRLGIAGGDTSSHAIAALDAWGLSYQSQIAPGVSLCRLHSDDKRLDGLEIMLKGGQMGPEDLFERLIFGAGAASGACRNRCRVRRRRTGLAR